MSKLKTTSLETLQVHAEVRAMVCRFAWQLGLKEIVLPDGKGRGVPTEGSWAWPQVLLLTSCVTLSQTQAVLVLILFILFQSVFEHSINDK